MRSGQIIQFPLSRGLAEDENAKAKPLAALKSGVNIRWPRSGCVGKRFGVRTIGDEVTGIRRFIVRGDELAATDGEQMIVYDAEADEWTPTGRRVSEVGLEWSTIHDDQSGVATSDLAVSGDLIIHAWVQGDPTRHVEATPHLPAGSQAYVQILNRETEQVVLAPVALEAPGSPSAYTFRHVRVLVADVYAFVIVTWDASVVVYPIMLATRTVGASQSLVTNVRTGGYAGRFDAVFLDSGSLALVYEKSGPATIQFERFTRSGTTFASAATATHVGSGVRCLRIAEDTLAARLYVLYSLGGELVTSDIRIRILDSSTGASVVSADVIEDFRGSQVSIAMYASGVMMCAVSGVLFGPDPANNDIVPMPQLVTFRLDDSGAIVTDTTAYSTNLTLLSDVFELNGRWYLLAGDTRYGERQYAIDPDNDFPTYTTELSRPSNISSYLLEVTEGDPPDNSSSIPHRLAGKIDHDIAAQFQIGLIPQIWPVDEAGTTLLGLLPFQATANENSFNWRCGLKLVQITVDPDLMPDAWRGVSIGRETYLAGGYLGVWDGRAHFDHGMRAPYVYDYTFGANGSIANGTYLYQFGAGYRSHVGTLHRSPLSVQITAEQETANGADLLVSLGSAHIDGKQTIETGFGRDSPGNAFFEAFRTEANGSTLYKLTYEPRFNTIPNDPGEWTTSLHDTKADDDITEDDDDEFFAVPAIPLGERPQPYTADGSLEDVQPPGSYSIHLHGGRIFTIDGSRRGLWYTKDFREDPSIAPGFNFVLTEFYDAKLTAMASLYSQRVVFHERGLFVIEGDGPNVSGLDNNFTTPRPIQSDVGCTNPRSVVSWAGGVVFQSGTDLYNLDGNLAIKWISKDAKDTLAAYPRITSAVLVADQNEIRFTCNDETQTAAIVLVFDYQRGAWMTRTYASGAPIRDAILHGGRWYFATTSAVYYEDVTTHLDAGTTFVPSTVELEPISHSGPVGWGRVRLVKPIGQSLSNHGLTVSVSRDWAASYEQTETFAAGSDVTTVGPYERAEVALTINRRQAVGLKFVDAAPANTTTHPLGNGAGFQLEGVALLVQPIPGMPRDTSSRRGG